jgi:uracil-DNA glycosylase
MGGSSGACLQLCATSLDTSSSEGWLGKLLALLPQLQVVVLLGDVAHRLTADLYVERPDLHVLHGPHPSWRGVPTPKRRKWLENAVRKARDLVC